MEIRSLLYLLSDGNYHSGSELGDKLGVSRSAVWKALNKLDELNLSIEKSRSKGYRLPGGLELLDLDALDEMLPDEVRKRCQIDLSLSVDSTNQVTLNLLNDGDGKVYRAVLAEMQTSGRGRRGREWCSPFGQNIYLSVGFELLGGVEALNGLSLVIGIAAVRAIQSLGEVDVKLKWPNDLWVNGEKLAGILVELRGEPTSSWNVVVGIGVNVSMDERSASSIDQPWTSLNKYISCGRNELAAALVSHMVDVLDLFQKEGLKAFVPEWDQYDALSGKVVGVVGGDLQGVACGVDAFGALMLRKSTGEIELINAGEVSVRPHEV